MHRIALAAAVFFPIGALAAVHAVSTDGEATVYLAGDFSKGFTVAYHARLDRTQSNRSWTVLGIMLVGAVNPGPAVEVGLTRANGAQAVRVFTTQTSASGTTRYESRTAHCNPACDLVLRGDSRYVYASIGSSNLAKWPRSGFAFVKPYVQINGEIARPGDAIAAILFPIRTVANSETIFPTCAFTTRGVRPSRLPDGTLTFSGTYRANASAAFVRLSDGRLSNRC
jgi:hypothetical protein